MRAFLIIIILLESSIVLGQRKANPVIENFGGIYKIKEATVLPDPNLKYKILIEIVNDSNDPGTLNSSLNNVARLINLHAVGGVPEGNLEVVLTVHGPATYSLLKNKAYKRRFGVENPNLKLLKELIDNDILITVCGQSLIGRDVSSKDLSEDIRIATSMLTTATTYQLKGYSFLKF